MTDHPNLQPPIGNPESPEFSVIITCYYEEKSIEEFYTRLSGTLESTGRSYEIVFVNDGSTDKTFDRLQSIFDKDPHVRVIMDLFSNAGQGCAITAGITEARGRHFVFMDSDLQLDPEDFPLLLAEFDKGADIVTGWRKERHDSLSRVIPSKLANVIMRRVSRHKSSSIPFGSRAATKYKDTLSADRSLLRRSNASTCHAVSRCASRRRGVEERNGKRCLKERQAGDEYRLMMGQAA